MGLYGRGVKGFGLGMSDNEAALGFGIGVSGQVGDTRWGWRSLL
jgi:hypothetical protein